MEENKQKISGVKNWLNFTWEILKIVIISLAIIIPIRYFLIQPFFVKGASMEPNFLNGDYLIVDEISYRLNAPQRGDVVIFRYPLDPSQFFIKRVIGLPGEKVKVMDEHVFVNDKLLDETKYLQGVDTAGNVEVVLGNDEYFVLGDNRQASSDSRRWGEVNKKFIIGRAWLRAWPFNRLGVVNK
jgi:signal peptidase I